MDAPPPIYLDHHATTPVDPRVLEAMLPAFGPLFGNAASKTHAFGWQAEALVEQAREQTAALIGAEPAEIIFTSGATESNNLAIKGVAGVYATRGRHIITAQTEHRAVLDPCRALERAGFDVTYLAPEADGRVTAGAVRAALRPETILVSLMLANNESGMLNPVAEVGEVCHQARAAGSGVLLHCDAVQALAWEPIDVHALGADLLSISAHKMYGPKGVGALYVRRRDPRVRLAPQIEGGGHERGLRSGTLNVPGIVGLGRGAELALEQRAEDVTRVRALRDRLAARLLALPGATLNGTLEHRLPNNLNVAFAGLESEALLTRMRGLAVSSGSACTSSELSPSHVLLAMGVPESLARASLRFGLGRGTTADEIDTAAAMVEQAVTALRAANTP